MVKPPANIPPAPSPAIALAMMKIMLFGDKAQMREPSVKIDITVTKVYLRSKFWKILPHVGIRAVFVRR
jgi:hypothetical protein